MPGMNMSFSTAWTVLEGKLSANPSKWHSYRLEGSACERDLALALDDEGHRHLLIPVDDELRLPHTRGPLSTSIAHYNFAEDAGTRLTGRYLDIFCRLRHLNRQFDAVVADVVAESSGQPDPAGVAVATVGNWRRLFTTLADAKTLSYQEQLALFGELSVLEMLAGARGEADPEWWTGADNLPHDFELPAASVEVKSMGEDSMTITVHGLQQLAETEGKPLYLAVLLVVEDANGRRLDELLEEICSASRQEGALRQKAARLGIGRGTQDYARFSVRTLEIGQVEEGFPRITAESLATGDAEAVRSLRYELDYGHVRPHLDRQQFIDVPEVLA